MCYLCMGLGINVQEALLKSVCKSWQTLMSGDDEDCVNFKTNGDQTVVHEKYVKCLGRKREAGAGGGYAGRSRVDGTLLEQM